MALNRHLPFGFGDLIWTPPSGTFFNDPFFQENLPHVIPGYSVTQNEREFQFSLDVPGVRANDIKLELEENRVVSLSGGRKITKEDGQVAESRFHKRFTLPGDVDTDKLSANLSSGVLVITAPKQEKAKTIKTIPILEGTITERITTD